jgi:hypothetical protein
MDFQTGTITITGLNPDLLRKIHERAMTVGYTAEEYLREFIEQQHTWIHFTPEETEELRKQLQAGLDDIAQGRCRTYPSADALMDDIEAKIEQRLQEDREKEKQAGD